MMRSILIGAAASVALAGAASAAVTVTYSSTVAPTYENTLNFDEVGGPTGLVAGNAFASRGISLMEDGTNGAPFIAPGTAVGPWLGTGNLWGGQFGNPFGAYLYFDSNVTHLSAQYWDSSGPGSFFGGGAIVAAFDHGVEMASFYIQNPTYSASGPTWIDIVSTGGMSFNEVRFASLGFGGAAFVDNLSWTVPAPSSAALLGLGGLTLTRRRRAR